ncbi:MAG: LysE family translocator [Bradyrhizobium sp.]|nr:MAG: LysE family translocator [Bradyrhizobium sp.]
MSFFPSLGLFGAFVAASVLLALTPGPDMAFFLTRTLRDGRSCGFAALAGALSGVVVHTFAAALGLSALIAASARAYDAVKIAGALYLLYLAWAALRHGATLKFETGGAPGGLRSAYLAGLLINLTNPKIILFFVTFLPQFIDVGDPNPSARFFVLGFSFILIGGAINAAMIAVAGRFVAAARANPRAMRGFDYGFAGLMGLFAARLIAGAAR